MIIGLAILIMIFIIWSIVSAYFAFDDEYEGELISNISKIYWIIIAVLVLGALLFWLCYEVSTAIVCDITNNDYPQCVNEEK